MRAVDSAVRCPDMIGDIPALADAIGLTGREVWQAIRGTRSRHTAACLRMLTTCLDDEVLNRCSAEVIELLDTAIHGPA